MGSVVLGGLSKVFALEELGQLKRQIMGYIPFDVQCWLVI